MWRALIVSGVVLASVDLLYVFLPAWALSEGVPAIIVGWLLGARAAVAVVSRLGIARVIRKVGRKAFLVTCLILGVLGAGLLLLNSLPAAWVAMILFGVALGIPQPLTLGWVVARSPDTIRGAALGLRVTSNRAVQVVLPLLIGSVIAPTGNAGAFIAMASLLSGAAVITATAGDTLSDETNSDDD